MPQSPCAASLQAGMTRCKVRVGDGPPPVVENGCGRASAARHGPPMACRAGGCSQAEPRRTATVPASSRMGHAGWGTVPHRPSGPPPIPAKPCWPGATRSATLFSGPWRPRPLLGCSYRTRCSSSGDTTLRRHAARCRTWPDSTDLRGAFLKPSPGRTTAFCTGPIRWIRGAGTPPVFGAGREKENGLTGTAGPKQRLRNLKRRISSECAAQAKALSLHDIRLRVPW